MANQQNACFGCGPANPRGMQLQFERDEQRQRVTGRFRLGAEFQGGQGMIHGGIVATVLDEVMSKVNGLLDELAVTAELKIDYLKPIRVGQELVVEGFLVKREGRQLYHEGEIRDAQGALLARAKGRFVVIDREQFAAKLREASAVDAGAG